ncbi:hypothetical protein HIV01_010335 [Lysobacter arenosi]|jgi:hypothetical protein|uniref:DUF4131 domain-containing protein n=1 Tax=Lysobacter arenosi TaxID=2795387 RepID=A0ABX7R695_9GAMM|nr:hypothetical protein [Lysobacter arenosi]QSX73640.1 hypothetical protein HIV01_010335 [Lysobacter arenosi]
MNRYLRAILSCIVFSLVLLLLHYVHVRYFSVDVVLYAAVLDAVLAAGATFALLWLVGFLKNFSSLERVLLASVWLLAGYAFAISIPTVIDRSLSFYILEKLQQRGGGIREDRMKDVFVNEYVVEHRLVDIRLTEQLQSGTIEISNGCVHLTGKGERMASFGRFYRTHLLPKKRLIMGEYTDDLTDPFRDSVANVDYQCR